MEGIIGFIVLVAIARATIHALDAGWNKLVDVYRRREAEWVRTHPGRMKVARFAGVTAAVIHGTRPAWRAFKHDWLEHYRAVRASNDERFDRNPPAPPEEAKAPPPKRPAPKPTPPETAGAKPADKAEPPKQPEPAVQPEQPTKYEPLRVIPGGLTAPNTNGGTVYDLTTREITSIPDARNAINDYVTHKQAELDDATAQKHRAEAELIWLHSFGGAAHMLFDNDPETASSLEELVEEAQMAIDAAEKRIEACEAALGKSNVFLQRAESHRAMEEARDATPQASTNTNLYAGS